jgi:hypothetical protein
MLTRPVGRNMKEPQWVWLLNLQYLVFVVKLVSHKKEDVMAKRNGMIHLDIYFMCIKLNNVQLRAATSRSKLVKTK